MKKFKPKLSILPGEQKALWPRLAPLKDLGFTLYGGTAVALRLGHRRSVDFDFFTEQALDKKALRKALPFLKRAEVLQEGPDTLVTTAGTGAPEMPVKVSFFGGLSFGRFGTPELTEDKVLLVASLDDLMATKIKVLFDRAEQKDYEDLAAMILAGAELAKGIAIARQMFPGLSPQVAVQAMCYHKEMPTLSRNSRHVLIKAAAAVSELPEVSRLSLKLSS